MNECVQTAAFFKLPEAEMGKWCFLGSGPFPLFVSAIYFVLSVERWKEKTIFKGKESTGDPTASNPRPFEFRQKCQKAGLVLPNHQENKKERGLGVGPDGVSQDLLTAQFHE